MDRPPLLSYREVTRALNRDGWVVVRQRGSHIRLRKRLGDTTLNITVPAHNPIKRSTLSQILKDAQLNPEKFLSLLWPLINSECGSDPCLNSMS